MEVQKACFYEFPDECSDCPEYHEERQDLTDELAWLSWTGFGYPQHGIIIVKECKAFHKRRVEHQP